MFASFLVNPQPSISILLLLDFIYFLSHTEIHLYSAYSKTMALGAWQTGTHKITVITMSKIFNREHINYHTALINNIVYKITCYTICDNTGSNTFN